MVLTQDSKRLRSSWVSRKFRCLVCFRAVCCLIAIFKYSSCGGYSFSPNCCTVSHQSSVSSSCVRADTVTPKLVKKSTWWAFVKMLSDCVRLLNFPWLTRAGRVLMRQMRYVRTPIARCKPLALRSVTGTRRRPLQHSDPRIFPTMTSFV